MTPLWLVTWGKGSQLILVKSDSPFTKWRNEAIAKTGKYENRMFWLHVWCKTNTLLCLFVCCSLIQIPTMADSKHFDLTVIEDFLKKKEYPTGYQGKKSVWLSNIILRWNYGIFGTFRGGYHLWKWRTFDSRINRGAGINRGKSCWNLIARGVGIRTFWVEKVCRKYENDDSRW